MINPKKMLKMPNYQLVTLTKELATKYAEQLAAMADQIPLVEYTQDEILSEKKGERIFHGKWERSLLLMDNGR